MKEVRNNSLGTGFPSLDSMLGGGIRRGDLLTLGGDIGSGKSALALSMALWTTRQQGTAAFLSAEMNPDRVAERIIAIKQKVSINDLRQLGASADHNSLADGRLRVELINPGTSADELARHVSGFGPIDLVVIDHLQALATERNPLDEDLAAAVRRMKALALESGIAIILVAHCAVDRGKLPVPRPLLSDFGVLGAVKQHSDTVLTIYREEMYENARGIDGAAELHVLKNRQGGTGYVDLFFYKQWLRFEDMVDPE